MALKHLSEFKNFLGTQRSIKLVLAAAQDQNSLSAVMKAAADGLIEPILVGDKEEILKDCRRMFIRSFRNKNGS